MSIATRWCTAWDASRRRPGGPRRTGNTGSPCTSPASATSSRVPCPEGVARRRAGGSRSRQEAASRTKAVCRRAGTHHLGPLHIGSERRAMRLHVHVERSRRRPRARVRASPPRRSRSDEPTREFAVDARRPPLRAPAVVDAESVLESRDSLPSASPAPARVADRRCPNDDRIPQSARPRGRPDERVTEAADMTHPPARSKPPAEKGLERLDDEPVVLQLGEARDRNGADTTGAPYQDRESSAVGGVHRRIQP
jgi:hypothetical protein